MVHIQRRNATTVANFGTFKRCFAVCPSSGYSRTSKCSEFLLGQRQLRIGLDREHINYSTVPTSTFHNIEIPLYSAGKESQPIYSLFLFFGQMHPQIRPRHSFRTSQGKKKKNRESEASPKKSPKPVFVTPPPPYLLKCHHG